MKVFKNLNRKLMRLKVSSYTINSENFTSSEKYLMGLVKRTIGESKTTVTMTGLDNFIVYGDGVSISLHDTMLTVLTSNRLINTKIGGPLKQELFRYVSKVLNHQLVLFKKEFNNKLENFV